MITVNTVNIGNIHDKDGNKVEIKCEWKVLTLMVKLAI